VQAAFEGRLKPQKAAPRACTSVHRIADSDQWQPAPQTKQGLTMTILQAENLSFAFVHVALLDKTSFQLAAGDKVGLIGRNGAGKSSLLKILAGVQKPDDGQLILQSGLKTVYVP